MGREVWFFGEKIPAEERDQAVVTLESAFAAAQKIRKADKRFLAVDDVRNEVFEDKLEVKTAAVEELLRYREKATWLMIGTALVFSTVARLVTGGLSDLLPVAVTGGFFAGLGTGWGIKKAVAARCRKMIDELDLPLTKKFDALAKKTADALNQIADENLIDLARSSFVDKIVERHPRVRDLFDKAAASGNAEIAGIVAVLDAKKPATPPAVVKKAGK